MNANEKLREALEWAINECKEREDGGEYMGEGSDPAFENIRCRLQEALALPRINCDVGTAEEQYERFDKICSGKHTIEDCPLFEKTSPCCSPLCFARWAQMPYEEVKE